MRIIVIGAGEVGFHIAERLSDEKKDVVIVDRDEERTRFVRDNLDILAVTGAGSSPSVLREAGVADAELFIAVTDSDEVNMISCLIARDATSAVTTIARVRNAEFIERTNITGPDHLGLDLAINPEREAAEQIQRLLEVPAARQVYDFGDGRVRLVGLDVQPASEILGVELRYLKELQPGNGVLLAAIERDGRVLIPHGSDKIEKGDRGWFVTQIARTNRIVGVLGQEEERIEQLVIFGGTNVGHRLAESMIKSGVRVKIIDPDLARCERLAADLKGAIVLHGSAVDQDLLTEENIGQASAFVAATDDDEDNVLSVLLAKQVGVPRVATLLNKRVYGPVVSAIGVDKVVSKRMAAVDRIMQFVRKGKVLASTSIEGLDVELLEFAALPTSDVVDVPIKDLKLPDGAILGAIVRGDQTIIPSGDDVVRADDRVTIFAKRKAVSKIERMFSVKVEFF